MSPTEICNLALQHLGESRILSIEDSGDKVSRTCAVNFPQARDEALRSARWPCAKKQAELSKLAQKPLAKWAAAYQLPTDFIRLIEIEGEDAWSPREYFDQLGNTLVMGSEDDDGPDTIIIEYIRREEDTQLFDPLLVDCVSMLLAIKCARALTGSDSKAQDLRSEYERVTLPRAQTVYAQQLYNGKNHPIRQFLGKSLLGRAGRSGGISNVGYDD